MKYHRINGLFVSKDHQQKCRKACTLWKLACSSCPCFTLGITRNLVIELHPPASLCSPREPVLLLCTGPLLKPEDVKKKKKCRKRGLPFKVASSNKFLNATVIFRELRYATSFKKGWREADVRSTFSAQSFEPEGVDHGQQVTCAWDWQVRSKIKWDANELHNPCARRVSS